MVTLGYSMLSKLKVFSQLLYMILADYCIAVIGHHSQLNDVVLACRVDYLSLDVEGAELDILQTIPWDKVDIRYACI